MLKFDARVYGSKLSSTGDQHDENFAIMLLPDLRETLADLHTFLFRRHGNKQDHILSELGLVPSQYYMMSCDHHVASSPNVCRSYEDALLIDCDITT